MQIWSFHIYISYNQTIPNQIKPVQILCDELKTCVAVNMPYTFIEQTHPFNYTFETNAFSFILVSP